MIERGIQNLVRIAASRIGAVLFRNNTGQGWSGNARRIDPRSVLIEDARPIHFGLIKGSSDLIGFKSVVITPDFLGRTVAVFVAIEVKTARGRLTPEQDNFLQQVRRAGGIAFVARSIEDVEGNFTAWTHNK